MAIVSISALASSDLDDGHFYWMYKSIREQSAAFSELAAVTIGPLASASEFSEGVITDDAPRFRFRVGPFFMVRHRWQRVIQRIVELHQAGYGRFQFYDGGLPELFIALVLSKRLPQAQFVYNFHWATQWVEVCRAGRPSAAFLRSAIRRVLHNRPRNLIISAETKKLALLLEETFGVGFRAYPVFSALQITQQREWELRTYDVLVFPQRASEILHSLRLLERLRLSGLTVHIATKRVCWNEWFASAQHQTDLAILASSVSPTLTPLERDDYLSLMENVKVVVLPYFDPYFEWGSSGKFNEAIAAGAFPFVPMNSAIASQSTLAGEHHHYPSDDLSLSAKKIINRLRLGSDSGLRAVTLSDLMQLFEPPSSPTGNPKSAPSRAGLWALLVACFTYREDKHRWTWARLRRKVGGLYDRIAR